MGQELLGGGGGAGTVWDENGWKGDGTGTVGGRGGGGGRNSMR